MKDDMKILSGILSSGDVRRLPEEQLPELAREARETILKTAAENGGHFASNLGAVELTVALHRCFSVPEERIVFDVGHQAYTHKLLTGRYGDFSTLRRYGGLSGFTNREESSSDAVTAGHSGSALSLAVGMADHVLKVRPVIRQGGGEVVQIRGGDELRRWKTLRLPGGAGQRADAQPGQGDQRRQGQKQGGGFVFHWPASFRAAYG